MSGDTHLPDRPTRTTHHAGRAREQFQVKLDTLLLQAVVYDTKRGGYLGGGDPCFEYKIPY